MFIDADIQDRHGYQIFNDEDELKYLFKKQNIYHSFDIGGHKHESKRGQITFFGFCSQQIVSSLSNTCLTIIVPTAKYWQKNTFFKM